MKMTLNPPSFVFALNAAICLVLVTSLGCKKSESPSSTSATNSPSGALSTGDGTQTRLDWNQKTLVDAYRQVGRTNPSWDDAALRALSKFAMVRATLINPDEDWQLIIGTNCAAAIAAGCDDPLIRYLHERFSPDLDRSNPITNAYRFAAFAKDMRFSSYPGIRKFYCGMRGREALKEAYPISTNAPQYLRENLPIRFISDSLATSLRDPTIPTAEIYEMCNSGLPWLKGSPDDYRTICGKLLKPFFQSRTNDPTIWLLKGETEIEVGWLARGGGYADKVTEEGWKTFSDRLASAEQSLARAWELDTNDVRISLAMLTLELGQGQGRDRMELWFQRAMARDTNSYQACNRKLFYLEPKWYGSEEDMIAFGWDCVESTNWGGNTPLTLLDAHLALQRYLDKSERDDYWKRPEVWPDLKAAFDRFFQLNPEATGWYHNYAWYAYHCERWDKLNELLPKLGPVNYSYFGGKDAFDKMARLAQEHAGDVLPEPNPLFISSRRVLASIASKVNQGKHSEDEFGRELKLCDDLLARNGDQDVLAAILLAKARLYLEVLDQSEKGKELLRQLGRDFSTTKIGSNAPRILDSVAAQEEAKRLQRNLVAGAPFPAFEEKDLHGKTLSLEAYRGKIVLIDFWATWCGPCVAEMPNLLKTYEQYHDKGFEVIGLSLDDDAAKLEKFIKSKDIQWPQFSDGQGWGNKLALKCGIESIPATFLLDREGKIITKDLRGEALPAAVAKALSLR